jgi:xylulokinase
MKLNVELLKRAGIEINELRATGGGAKSATWMQIKSDIMDIPIVSLDVSETGCLGAALLAAKAYGHNDSVEQMSEEWVRQVRTYEPSRENVKKYRERFGIFSQIYKTLKPLGNLINGL